jgi:hypothetical protein
MFKRGVFIGRSDNEWYNKNNAQSTNSAASENHLQSLANE